MWAPAHLLRQVLASDTLNVISEELLFETVVKWANFREDQDDCSRTGNNSSLSNVLSAERHTTRPASLSNTTDEAVLKCYRSPSNLSLLPHTSSPFAVNRHRSGNPRRKPELTREAYTNALHLSSTSIPSPVSSSPRFSISATKLQSSPRDSMMEPQSSNSSVWSRMFDRKQFLNSLLPCIRFPMMDKNFLLRVVERDTDLMALPMMKDLLIEAYRFHAFNPPQVKVEPAMRDGNRRSSECYAKREYAANTTPVVYAKIILPLNTTDELTLSRSQRRKHHNVQKLDIQAVNF
ncbi:hypothetical protein GGI16_002975 [Coemansia sp. S142-1]|nr:hypothetical protein GGI16_002975 [Coemansia sp. S142-1]